MKVHMCAQGSPEWIQLRCGIPSASQFHRIVTPKKRERSAQLDNYAMDLVAERMTGRPLVSVTTAAMQGGIEREPQAVASYELEYGCDAHSVGFITTDDGKIGASPDRIITVDGNSVRGLECKSPLAHTHIGYLLGKGPDESYLCQLQGQMLVCEWQEVDIISCFPGLPDKVVRVSRDDNFIAALRMHLSELNSLIDLHITKLANMGYEAYQPGLEQPHPFDVFMGDGLGRAI